jgi:hypothetical protein
MKIIGIAMVRNEDDVLESFIRHNLNFLDHLSVISHASTDQTDTILEKLVAEGLPLDFEISQERTFLQGERLTELARKVFAGSGADIVIPLDADEFIKAPSREALRALFGKLPRTVNAAWAPLSYVPLESDDAALIDPVARITHRRISEEHSLHKAILTQSFANDTSLCLLEGSHSVFRITGAKPVASPHAIIREMSLAHFPVRSPQQIVKKLLINVWSRMVAPHDLEASYPIAWHWKKLYMKILAEGAPAARQLSDLAYIYQNPIAASPVCDMSQLVYDPLDVKSHLRYTSNNPLACLHSIAQWVDVYIDLNMNCQGDIR